MTNTQQSRIRLPARHGKNLPRPPDLNNLNRHALVTKAFSRMFYLMDTTDKLDCVINNQAVAAIRVTAPYVTQDRARIMKLAFAILTTTGDKLIAIDFEAKAQNVGQITVYVPRPDAAHLELAIKEQHQLAIEEWGAANKQRARLIERYLVIAQHLPT